MERHEPVDVLIVGAGLAGVAAGRSLLVQGRTVLLLDKGRKIGGRMATRRLAHAVYDYGAQFFTVRQPAFQELIQSVGPFWEAPRVWCHGFPAGNGEPVHDGHPRYCCWEGMSSLPEVLARDLPVVCSARVTSLHSANGFWQVQLENQATYQGRALLLTPPVPQSRSLLKTGAVSLPSEVNDALAAITYDPCLALLIQLSDEGAVPAPGAVRPAGEPLHILADNFKKGISPRPGSLTLHAGPEFSARMYDAPLAEILDPLLSAAEPWFGAPRERVDLHRWRYAQPRVVHPERYLGVEHLRLCFAGDAFGGPRVEGAALSGLAAGVWLNEHLNAWRS